MEPLVRVKNQFLFAPPDSAAACVPISIMATFHQYDLRHQERAMDEHHWTTVMRRGTELWRRWRARTEHRHQLYPTVEEVLALPECETFVREFGRAPVEYAGLVRDSHGCDNPQGSLEHMLCDMVDALLSQKERREAVCCLLVLPGAICVSMLCLRRRRDLAQWYEIRFFDSHGCRTAHDFVDFAVFDDYRQVLAHIAGKYHLPRLEARERDAAPHDIERIQAQYGYSAMLFKK